MIEVPVMEGNPTESRHGRLPLSGTSLGLYLLANAPILILYIVLSLVSKEPSISALARSSLQPVGLP